MLGILTKLYFFPAVVVSPFVYGFLLDTGYQRFAEGEETFTLVQKILFNITLTFTLTPVVILLSTSWVMWLPTLFYNLLWK